MLAIVVHGVPHAWERAGDDVQDVDAAGHKGHVVVLDEAAGELRRALAGLGQKVALRLGLEQLQRPHALFQGGHVLVGPVGGLKVRRHLGAGGAQEVEQDEEADGAQGGGKGRERLVGGCLPVFGQGSGGRV